MNRKETIAQIKRLVKSRTKAALWLATKQPWDFFFCLFRATDLIQHLDYNGRETAAIYQQIDRSIGQIKVIIMLTAGVYSCFPVPSGEE